MFSSAEAFEEMLDALKNSALTGWVRRAEDWGLFKTTSCRCSGDSKYEKQDLVAWRRMVSFRKDRRREGDTAAGEISGELVGEGHQTTALV